MTRPHRPAPGKQTVSLKPGSVDELSQSLARADSGARQVEAIDLSALNRIQAHAPEDMTVRVETGITLARFQSLLAAHRQWLPIDPPSPDTTTLLQILSHDLSGPRRFGHGTIREHLIGLTAVLANGTVIKSGGNVVKNVAGYDLCKLFVGNRDTLGVITDATFKLLPLPEHETFLSLHCPSLDQVAAALQRIRLSPVRPVVLDLDTLQAETGWTLTIGFAGTRVETGWQIDQVRPIGFSPIATLKEQPGFWAGTPAWISVAPTRLPVALATLRGRPLIARIGSGTLYHQGPAVMEPPRLPIQLMQRVKDHFDPNHTLPGLPW